MPTTPPDEQLLVAPPGFAPLPPKRTDPTTTTRLLTPEDLDLDLDPDPLGGWDDDERPDEKSSPASTTTGGSSPASTPGDPADFEELAGTVVGIASLIVRFARTRRRVLPDQVWMADEGDMARIGAPLARLAARHSPISGGEAGDVGDVLAITAGTAVYALNNLQAEAEHGGPILDLSPDDG